MVGTAENLEKSKLGEYTVDSTELLCTPDGLDVSERIGNDGTGICNGLGWMRWHCRVALVVALLRADWYRIPP